jgi:hypothetical protein
MTLSPRARELLEAYRQAEAPPAKTLDRILDAVNEHPIVAPTPGLDVDPQTISAAGPGSSVLAKIGASAGAKILAATIAVSLPAAWWVSRSAPDGSAGRGQVVTPTAPAVAPTHASQGGIPERTDKAPSRPLRLSDLPLPAAASSKGRARTTDGEAPARPGSSDAPAVVLDESPAPSASAPTGGTLAEEVTLLARANEALTAGDPRRALALVKEHQSRFPASRLAEARAVTRALSLCAAGHLAEGQAAALAILEVHPASPFAERLRSACSLKIEQRTPR